MPTVEFPRLHGKKIRSKTGQMGIFYDKQPASADVAINGFSRETIWFVSTGKRSYHLASGCEYSTEVVRAKNETLGEAKIAKFE